MRIRWSNHALKHLKDREIDKTEAEQTINKPGFIVPEPPDREIRMRLYHDNVLNKEMLMRIVVEKTQSEIVIVTVYKTSQINRYLKGLKP